MYRGQNGNIGNDVRVKRVNKMVNITKIVLYLCAACWGNTLLMGLDGHQQEN